MRLERMIGMVKKVLLVLILTSCTKIDIEYVPLKSSLADTEGKYINKKLIDSSNNELKEFYNIDTKATLTPIWEEGDMISVYSLDKDEKVLFIDTCTVYNINKNKAKITAEVAKESYKYFAVYPYNHFICKVGENIDFGNNYYINYNGNFGDVSIMTAYCPKNDSSFKFINRFSLLRITNINSYNFPITVKFFYNNGTVVTRYQESFNGDSYYIPIDYKDVIISKIEITYRKRNILKYQNTTVTKYPKYIMYPSYIYSYTLEK